MIQFFMERAALELIQTVQKMCKECKVEVSTTIRRRSKQQSVQIPKQIQRMMCEQLENENRKLFKCKFCQKQFKEGRELGGHISRAHKNRKDGLVPKTKKIAKKYDEQDYEIKEQQKQQLPATRSQKQKLIKKVTERLPIKRKFKLSKKKYVKSQFIADKEIYEDQGTSELYQSIKEEDQEIKKIERETEERVRRDGQSGQRRKKEEEDDDYGDGDEEGEEGEEGEEEMGSSEGKQEQIFDDQ